MCSTTFWPACALGASAQSFDAAELSGDVNRLSRPPFGHDKKGYAIMDVAASPDGKTLYFDATGAQGRTRIFTIRIR